MTVTLCHTYDLFYFAFVTCSSTAVARTLPYNEGLARRADIGRPHKDAFQFIVRHTRCIQGTYSTSRANSLSSIIQIVILPTGSVLVGKQSTCLLSQRLHSNLPAKWPCWTSYWKRNNVDGTVHHRYPLTYPPGLPKCRDLQL